MYIHPIHTSSELSQTLEETDLWCMQLLASSSKSFEKFKFLSSSFGLSSPGGPGWLREANRFADFRFGIHTYKHTYIHTYIHTYHAAEATPGRLVCTAWRALRPGHSRVHTLSPADWMRTRMLRRQLLTVVLPLLLFLLFLISSPPAVAAGKKGGQAVDAKRGSSKPSSLRGSPKPPREEDPAPPVACPCSQNGTCSSWSCACADGWAGQNCDTCALGRTGESCSECVEGYYGPTCTACNCPPNSTCDDTGSCTCDAGWAGLNGPNCNACAAGYFGSTCTACTCPSNSTCADGLNGGGACTCDMGWTGESCDVCAEGYYGPTCTACNCPPNSTCDDTGSCTCDAGWAGLNEPNCNACAAGYFGSACTACTCPPHSTCDDGLDGGGTCTCDMGWTGESCDVCAEGHSGDACTPDPISPYLACIPSDCCDPCAPGYFCEAVDPAVSGVPHQCMPLPTPPPALVGCTPGTPSGNAIVLDNVVTDQAVMSFPSGYACGGGLSLLVSTGGATVVDASELLSSYFYATPTYVGMHPIVADDKSQVYAEVCGGESAGGLVFELGDCSAAGNSAFTCFTLSVFCEEPADFTVDGAMTLVGETLETFGSQKQEAFIAAMLEETGKTVAIISIESVTVEQVGPPGRRLAENSVIITYVATVANLEEVDALRTTLATVTNTGDSNTFLQSYTDNLDQILLDQNLDPTDPQYVSQITAAYTEYVDVVTEPRKTRRELYAPPGYLAPPLGNWDQYSTSGPVVIYGGYPDEESSVNSLRSPSADTGKLYTYLFYYIVAENTFPERGDPANGLPPITLGDIASISFATSQTGPGNKDWDMIIYTVSWGEKLRFSSLYLILSTVYFSFYLLCSLLP
jgi:hypothetical protein